jgi:hypothetical protein
LFDRSSLRISLVASIPSMTGNWMSIYISWIQGMTHQDQVVAACPPLFNRLETVFCSPVLDLFLSQKHAQNVLIDGIICHQHSTKTTHLQQSKH